jgi:Flp pilus assembly pilin Flp
MKKLREKLLALHRDEGGADMVEYILLIAIIALPLIGVLIWYWKEINTTALGLWDQVKSGTGTNAADAHN